MRTRAGLAVMLLLTTASFANDFYPLSIGRRWQYQGSQADSLGQPIPATDYLDFTTIVGDTMINGLTYFVQRDSSNQGGGWYTGDSYVRTAGDTIKSLTMVMDTTALQEINLAILPGFEGQSWVILSYDTTYDEGGQTVTISFDWTGEHLGTETVTVPAGTFPGSVHMQMEYRTSYRFGSFEFEYEAIGEGWAALNVGPVRWLTLPSESFGFPVPGYLEELTDYFLAAPPAAPVAAPQAFRLDPAAPNPFNPVTRLSFHLSEPGRVALEIHDVRGNLVSRLAEAWYDAGAHQVEFDAAGLSSGTYFVTLRAGDKQATGKVTLVR